jgi:hypothetical protein
VRRSVLAVLTLSLVFVGVLAWREARPSAQANKLVVYGDITLFAGLGKPDNCMLKSRYKRGEPVGFRMTAIDPATGKYERYRGTAKQPELEFWVAKWVVPADAPTGIIRYSVTAKDKQGRTGEFKPFRQDLSELTVVE